MFQSIASGGLGHPAFGPMGGDLDDVLEYTRSISDEPPALAENFSGAFPPSAWTPTGNASQELVQGYRPPALRLSEAPGTHGLNLTSTNDFVTTERGMAATVELFSAVTSSGQAAFQLLRPDLTVHSSVVVDYSTNPPTISYATPNGANSEQLNIGGAQVRFTWVMFPDGTTRWHRFNTLMVDDTTPAPTTSIGPSMGIGGFAGTGPGFVLFDDLRVEKGP